MARNDVPRSQQIDAFELVSKGVKQLIRLEFRNYLNTMYLSNEAPVNYDNKTWQQWAYSLTGVGKSTGENTRPKFTIANPEGIFSTLIEQGKMDGAIVSRYQILVPDLEANVKAYTKQMWKVSKVLSLNRDLATFELRSLMDGQKFDIPARSFYPPDFPHVSLQ